MCVLISTEQRKIPYGILSNVVLPEEFPTPYSDLLKDGDKRYFVQKVMDLYSKFMERISGADVPALITDFFKKNPHIKDKVTRDYATQEKQVLDAFQKKYSVLMSECKVQEPASGDPEQKAEHKADNAEQRAEQKDV